MLALLDLTDLFVFIICLAGHPLEELYTVLIFFSYLYFSLVSLVLICLPN